MSEALIQEIQDLKKRLGPEVMILGHHYQRAGIIKVADIIGDSFGLAKAASKATNVKKIVFCGVRFMAESAAILARQDQLVYHPEPEAGCPMADMAPMESVEECWSYLSQHPELQGKKIIPVTYMNSHAPLKGFTGKHGGAVCTSSNAGKVLDWAWKQGDIVLFFPDQHLGRNTAKTMGLSAEQMAVWHPSKSDGGIETYKDLKILLWNGHCPVHMKFSARDARFVKKNFPGSLVVVHPECDADLVKEADASGSTEFILKYVQSLALGTRVFVGTEINMVERLRKENPKIKVEVLSRSLCPTMYMVDLQKLRDTLVFWQDDKLVPMNDELRSHAKVALERMLALA